MQFFLRNQSIRNKWVKNTEIFSQVQGTDEDVKNVAWSRAKRVPDERDSWNMRAYFFFVHRIYREYTRALRAHSFPPPSLFSVSLARKEPEPLNARGEPSVVVYLHNLWGSKNAKKLISRPRHRPPSSLRLPASSLVYTCSTPRSSPSTSSASSSSFARVCPRPFRPGLLRSLGALSRLFPEVRINFYLVCGVRNLFRDAPFLSHSFRFFFPSIASPSCCDFIMSWQEVRINPDVVSLSTPLPARTSFNMFCLPVAAIPIYASLRSAIYVLLSFIVY